MVGGRKVLVTGSTQGIGLELACALRGAGASVVLHGLRRDDVALAVEADAEASAVRVAPAAATSGQAGPAGDAELLAEIRERWPAVLAAVEQRDRNLSALLKDARPVAVDGTEVSLGFFYAFHAKRAGQDDKAQVISAALSEVWGQPLRLRCLVVPASADEQATRPRSKAEQAGQDPLVRFAVESLGASIGGVKDLPEEPAS